MIDDEIDWYIYVSANLVQNERGVGGNRVKEL